MKLTGWGALLWGVVATLFAIALAIGSIVPAVAAIVLATGLEGTRARLQQVEITAQRSAPETIEEGRQFTVTTRVQSNPPVPLVLLDAGLLGVTINDESKLNGYGHIEASAKIQVTGAGSKQWSKIQVSVQDPWGIHELHQIAKAPHTLQVAPATELRTKGRIAGRRHSVQTMARDPQGHDPSLEIEGTRDYMPGDKLRDIDWAHSSRGGPMIVRTREPMAPRPILVLVDGTISMRWQRRIMRLESSLNFATAMMAGARSAGVRPGLVVYGEDGIIRGATQQSDNATAQQLQAAGSPIPIKNIPPPFPAASQVSRQVASSMELGLRALDAATRGPAFVAAVLDAEWAPDATEIAIRRLLDRGHKVALISPAMGAHQYTRGDLPKGALSTLASAQRNRALVAKKCAQWGVPMFVLQPGPIEELVAEVLQCAK